MANLPENATWEPGIYQLETTDPVVGGPPNLATGEGIDNVPTQQLANRTLFLKLALEALQASVGAIDVSGQIDTRINQLIDGAPAAMDTLNELAAAIGDNDNELAALVAQIAGKLGVTETAANSHKLGGVDAANHARTDVEEVFNALVNFARDVTFNAAGYGMVIKSDTALRTFMTMQQDGVNVGLFQISANGDLNYGTIGGREMTINGHVIQHAGNMDASKLMQGTVPDARLPSRLGPHVTALADWDDITEIGHFMGAHASNGPGAGWWLGSSVAHNANWVTVTAHQFTGDSSADTKIMRREKNNGVWGAWYPVLSSEAEITAHVSPYGKLLAWARWNGVGGVTINASANVSSIVRVAAGIYDVNFATALPDYIALCNARQDTDSNDTASFASARLHTATSVRVIVTNDVDANKEDAAIINIGVFG